MEEEIYFGEYVFVNYLTPLGEEVVYGGQLEKIILDGNKYKFLFKSIYDLSQKFSKICYRILKDVA